MQITKAEPVLSLGVSTRNHRAQFMRDLMDREKLDALVFTTADYFRFATNFVLDSAPSICVVPRNGDAFVILHELSQYSWRFQSEAQRLWIADASFYSEHPRVHSRAPEPLDEVIAAKLEQAGLTRARIGTDGGNLSGVAKLLPNLVVDNVEYDCQRLRWVKHEEEISLMHAACSLTDWAQERFRENVRPGRLIDELDGTIMGMMSAEAARRFPHIDLQPICVTLTGPVSASPHGIGSAYNLAGSRIAQGDVLVCSIFPIIEGLFVENERTWFCGKPSPRQVQLFEAARAANEAACEAAVTGNPIWAIDAAAQAVFERAGLSELICARTGHGLGIGGHDFPIDMAFNNSPLLDRMVFSVEPGLYEFGLGGFRHDDTVVVGEKPRILTTTPRDLKSQTII